MPLNLNLRLKRQYPSEQAGRPLRQRRASGGRLVLRAVDGRSSSCWSSRSSARVLVVLTGPTEFGLDPRPRRRH